MKAFLYILSASPDPNRIKCAVPWKIDSQTIFFGPCKKRLRRWMKRNILDSQHEAVPDEALFIIGLNGANPEKIRKIVWAGQVSRVMTFGRAFQSLTGANYSRMRRYRLSPLHLEPVEVDGKFGYRHRSEEHDENDSWVWDVVDRAHAKDIDQQEDKILLLPGVQHQEVLAIDCCFLCKNIFYARGSGLPISDDIFSVLRAAQPGKEIDEYAIFGRQHDGKANGLRGTYCEITNPTQILRLVEAIKMQAVSLRGSFDQEDEETVISCLRGCRD